jgi:hypothetical protein
LGFKKIRINMSEGILMKINSVQTVAFSPCGGTLKAAEAATGCE